MLLLMQDGGGGTLDRGRGTLRAILSASSSLQPQRKPGVLPGVAGRACRLPG